MSEWIDFPRRGECPVKPQTVVRIKFRTLDGRELVSSHAYKAKDLRWDKFPGQRAALPFDIIAYRVEGEA